jgi:phosphomannomutase/phosphoglucomutase
MITGSKKTNHTVFKKYDIRGIVDHELFIDDTYRIAQAIATYFRQQQPTLTSLIVGMDGRIHSPQIKQQVCTAIQDMGINVIFIGVCPTPAFYYANQVLPAAGGIMITASHNPKEYNGLKLLLNKINVFDQEITAIKDLFFSDHQFLPAHRHGNYQEHDIISAYINFLESQFAALKHSTLTAVIDCAHGATAAVIPQLVQRMSWKNVKLINDYVDGNFPAHEANPTIDDNIKDVQQRIKITPNCVGIGFDGDGDRMVAVTEQGTPVRGDECYTLFAQALAEEIGPFTLVVDIKCANALLRLLQSHALNYILAPCGVGFVRNEMRKHHALFGGELSCHYCFNDRYFGYDDGIYAMMRLFELITTRKTTLQHRYAQLPTRYFSPELRIHCAPEKKWTIVEQVKKEVASYPNSSLITIDGIRLEVPHGCVTLRASNTEPLISLRIEGTNQKNLDTLIQEFYTLLVPHVDRTTLAKTMNIKI